MLIMNLNKILSKLKKLMKMRSHNKKRIKIWREIHKNKQN